MTNLIQQLKDEQVKKLDAKIPEFKTGDTLVVRCKIKEGENERIQAYEGVCIARKNAGLNSSFTVRKISFGEGVERVFPLHSPNIAEIKVVRKGKVVRSKLYYLRGLFGKSARIEEIDANNAVATEKAEAKADKKA